MTTLAQLLIGGRSLGLHDVAEIVAGLAGLVRYGHELGAVHGDIGLETVLVDRRDDAWVVNLEQPRLPAAADAADPSSDVLALGRVVERLARALPARATVPPSFAAAVQSMTSASPAQRPNAAQVEIYFAEDLPAHVAELTEGAASAYSEPPSAPDPDADPRGPEAEQEDRWDAEPEPDERADPTGTTITPQGDQPAWTPTTYHDDPVMGGRYDDPDDPAVGAHHDSPSPTFALAEEPPHRSGRSAILVSSLVLVLGLGALGYVAWKALSPGGEAVASSVKETAPASEEMTEPKETEPEASRTDEPDTVTDQESADASSSAGSEDADTSAATTTSSLSDDHTDFQWAAHGWDAQALDEAYCRDGSRFVGLADTDTYRGVVCSTGWGYDYRGLNRAANATILASAEATDDGWIGHGTGGVRYEFDEDSFVIRDGDGKVLDEETVTLWLTPQVEPFRPGDLDLSQPISYPACDGSGVVVHSSHMDPSTNAETIQSELDAIPGSFYTRTDLSCDNFNRPSAETSSNGNFIYAVLSYGGDTMTELCSSITAGGPDDYGYFLEEGVPPGQIITCD